MLKTGMQRLSESTYPFIRQNILFSAEDLEKNIPRPKSPHMDNEEPIELAHYPAAHVPDPDTVCTAKQKYVKTWKIFETKQYKLTVF